jgi:hypothetical protein
MFQQLHILMRPGEVRVVRRAAFPGSRGAVERAFAVPAARGGADEPWRGSVQRLAEALAQLGARSGRMRVVVSDHFARYALIPWSAELVGDAERIALARVTFSEVYGPLADTWQVIMDEQPAGCPSLGCAIDRGLLQMLQDLAKAVGMRLTSIAPALADRINRHRRALAEATFCVASSEPGRLTLAFRHAGAWAALRSRRVDGAPTDGLAGALMQEAAAGGVPAGGTLYLIGEDLGALPAFSIPGWKVVRLNDGSALRPPAGDLVALAQSN